jgi:hypothetical protein
MSMTVTNMESPRTGRPVANQFIIEGEGRVIFQSYESKIAEINYNAHEIYIGQNWNYSMTTGKYRNQFFTEYFDALNNRQAIKKAKEIADINGYALIESNYGVSTMKVFFD